MIDGDSNSSMDKASTVENPTGTSGKYTSESPAGLPLFVQFGRVFIRLKNNDIYS